MTSPTPEASPRSKAAFEKYIQDVRNSIPPGSGLAGIEAAMMQHNSALLLEIMQDFDQEQELSPPRKARSGKPYQNW
jgi:hypothetical protein